MKKLNSNQRKFLRRVKNSIVSDSHKVNATEEYQAVYECNSRPAAQVNASQILNNPIAQSYLATILLRDCTPEDLSSKLVGLTEAEKDHVLPTGSIIAIRDNNTRLSAIQTILKVTGALRDGDTNIDARSINFNITGEDAKAIAELADRLDKLEDRSI